MGSPRPGGCFGRASLARVASEVAVGPDLPQGEGAERVWLPGTEVADLVAGVVVPSRAEGAGDGFGDLVAGDEGHGVAGAERIAAAFTGVGNDGVFDRFDFAGRVCEAERAVIAAPVDGADAGAVGAVEATTQVPGWT